MCLLWIFNAGLGFLLVMETYVKTRITPLVVCAVFVCTFHQSYMTEINAIQSMTLLKTVFRFFIIWYVLPVNNDIVSISDLSQAYLFICYNVLYFLLFCSNFHASFDQIRGILFLISFSITLFLQACIVLDGFNFLIFEITSISIFRCCLLLTVAV